MTRTQRRRGSIIPEAIVGSPQGEGPLRIGAHFVSKGTQHQMMSWEHLQEAVTSKDLNELIRHPDCESEYMNWAKGIRSHFGGLERYVAEVRLGWDRESLPTVNGTALASDVMNDEILDDLNNVKVVFNDWPYGIPPGCKHYVVWCKLPIMAPILFQTPDTPFVDGPSRDILFEGISADGIRGLTGNTRRWPIVGDRTPDIVAKALEEQIDSEGRPIVSPLGPTGLGPAYDLAEAAHLWAGRFAHKFIERFWDPREWETAYFCNPLHLRTVPGISHFHVIARKKE